eukprot:CAMPEP_0172751210 /NCGR_PEP_ID=MMETSP1074-20121228/151166_1 /TAXON_ID=2916 /ORGANISM="Ceratium fusus, Strain PA161109" /LENGTH=47 /DNA_ID= /DNA_START= /DNA_END= /DNA_ORIENTATION=
MSLFMVPRLGHVLPDMRIVTHCSGGVARFSRFAEGGQCQLQLLNPCE